MGGRKRGERGNRERGREKESTGECASVTKRINRKREKAVCAAQKRKAARRWQSLYEPCPEEEGSSREADVQGRGRRNRFYVPEPPIPPLPFPTSLSSLRVHVRARLPLRVLAACALTSLLSFLFKSLTVAVLRWAAGNSLLFWNPPIRNEYRNDNVVGLPRYLGGYAAEYRK